MKRTYIITQEEAEKIKEYRKNITNKYEDRRLYAVQLLGEGKDTKYICEKLDADKRQISDWAKKYCERGIESFISKRGGRHHENITAEKEQEVLNEFKEKAENGQIIEVSEIKKAYDKAVGRETHPTHIYAVLKRNNWSKKKPRSKHPKKASSEAIEASKKLSLK